MENDCMRRLNFIEARRFANGTSAFVHVCLGLQQDDTFASNAAFANEAIKAHARRAEMMTMRDSLYRHESDVMPVLCVLTARIAKPDEEQHEIPYKSKWPGEPGHYD